MGDVWPWRPPFHASPVVHKGPISSNGVSSQDLLLRKFWNFSLYSLNFCPNFSLQTPNFEIFSSQAPKIWKFSVHKPPNLEIFSSQAPLFQRQISVRKPHTSEIRAAHPYLKRSFSAPPPIRVHYIPSGHSSTKVNMHDQRFSDTLSRICPLRKNRKKLPGDTQIWFG